MSNALHEVINSLFLLLSCAAVFCFILLLRFVNWKTERDFQYAKESRNNIIGKIPVDYTMTPSSSLSIHV